MRYCVRNNGTKTKLVRKLSWSRCDRHPILAMKAGLVPASDTLPENFHHPPKVCKPKMHTPISNRFWILRSWGQPPAGSRNRRSAAVLTAHGIAGAFCRGKRQWRIQALVSHRRVQNDSTAVKRVVTGMSPARRSESGALRMVVTPGAYFRDSQRRFTTRWKLSRAKNNP